MPNSKTPNGIAEVPLTSFAIEAFKSQMAISGEGPFLSPRGHQTTFKTVWRKTLRRAKIPYFRNYDLRSTYATRLSAGGVADEWVTQMLQRSPPRPFTAAAWIGLGSAPESRSRGTFPHQLRSLSTQLFSSYRTPYPCAPSAH